MAGVEPTHNNAEGAKRACKTQFLVYTFENMNRLEILLNRFKNKTLQDEVSRYDFWKLEMFIKLLLIPQKALVKLQ